MQLPLLWYGVESTSKATEAFTAAQRSHTIPSARMVSRRWTAHPDSDAGSTITSTVPEKKNDSKPLQVTTKPNAGMTVLSKEVEYIDYIKSKSSAAEELIKIHDLSLNYKILKSLTDDRAWMEGDVVSAYIYHLRTKNNMLTRAGGKVFLETSIGSGYLKRDGGNNEDGTDIDVDPSDRKQQWIVNMVIEYLDSDMVFLPINMKDSHWYMEVSMPIQVLDSFGVTMNRVDLHKTLKGLTKYIEIAQQTIPDIPRNRWPDMEVSKWEMEEMVQTKTQTDSSSCGLFMLNYMEHFTGHELSKPVEQSDMSAFRRKIPLILFHAELNTDTRIFLECDEDPTPEITEPVGTTKGTSMGIVTGTSEITDPTFTTKKCISGVFPGISEVTAKQLEDGLEPEKIIVAGFRRNLGWGEGYAHFDIDDCTGTTVVSFVKWVKDDADEKQAAALEDDKYFSVIANFAPRKTKGHSTAIFVRPITDFNEVPLHFLKCIKNEVDRGRGKQ